MTASTPGPGGGVGPSSSGPVHPRRMMSGRTGRHTIGASSTGTTSRLQAVTWHRWKLHPFNCARGPRREHLVRAGGGAAGHPEAGVLGPDGLRGGPGGVRRGRRPGVHRRDHLRGQVVQRFRSGLVRRALVVGGGRRGGRCRGRAAAPPDPPASGHSWPVRRPADRARRPGTGAGDRGRLDGVADRWRQPRPGEGAGRHGRRGGQLARPAKGTRQRGLPGEHPGRLRRRLRRAVLQHGDRGAADPGGRPPGRAAVHQVPRRGDRGVERLVRHLLRHRRRRVPG